MPKKPAVKKKSKKKILRKTGTAKPATAKSAGRATVKKTAAGKQLPKAEIEKLRKMLTVMGEMVEHNVTTAVMSLVDRDITMAREVMRYEDEVDEMELNIDKFCCKLLLIAHPNEKNARFIFSAIKINMELERISDLTVDIAYQVIELSTQRFFLPAIIDFTENLENMEQAVRDAVKATLEMDTTLARSVLERRDETQERLKHTNEYLIDLLQNEPDKVRRLLCLKRATHAMRRILDQTTNIAEEVIYMAEGLILKHSGNSLLG